LPPPAAIGAFSVLTDFSRPSDSRQIFAFDGFPANCSRSIPNARPTIPIRVSPTAGTQSCLLCSRPQGNAPDPAGHEHPRLLLSDTALFHRALLGGGNDAQLVVFEALPHAFWYHFQLPETKECLELRAKSFDQKLARQN
jgi:epsilon-lactone hydrolase